MISRISDKYTVKIRVECTPGSVSYPRDNNRNSQSGINGNFPPLGTDSNQSDSEFLDD